jgi:hypothetical protein
VIEKDLLIQEKEKLYIELRRILARQPGPDVAQQMASHGKALAEKIKQLKIMTSNLAMYQVIILSLSLSLSLCVCPSQYLFFFSKLVYCCMDMDLHGY